MVKRNSERAELWTQITEALKIAELDFSDYLERRIRGTSCPWRDSVVALPLIIELLSEK